MDEAVGNLYHPVIIPTMNQLNVKTAKLNVSKVLASGLLMICLATQAEAKPWWFWQAKTPVKTTQYALPSNNGGVISVTIPVNSSKTASVKHGAGRHGNQSSAVEQRDDERIAADLERHF